jgi:hypothetical protein
MQVAEDTPDRDVQVRAARRRQALDALRFEQEREAMLVEQLEDVLAEAEGAVLDAVLFAQMSADDARRVQAALDGALNGALWQEGEESLEPDADGFGLTFDFDDDGADPDATAADEFEAEVARLREVIESSRLVQAALQQYLALVNAE